MKKVFSALLTLLTFCPLLCIQARIQETLIEANEAIFSPRSIQVELLKNCPETIPTLVEWLYEEWHTYDPALTKEKLTLSLQSRLNVDKLPLTFVALKKDQPVGIISLKKESAPEFADLPKDSLWIGSFHVVAAERNQGLGQALAELVTAIASQLGHSKLYFYSSNPANVPRYLKRGAEVIDKRIYHNHMVTLLSITAKKPQP